MNLRYQAEMGGLCDCPTEEFAPKNRVGFRFCREDVQDTRNWTPGALLQPGRNWGDNSCIAWALSLWNDETAARRKFRKLKKRNKNIHKRIGTHLAEVMVVESDGVSDAANSAGHFSLFQSSECSLVDVAELKEEPC